MTNLQILKQNVLNKLQTLSVCHSNSTNTQWTIRCPFCGDSRDPTHGHLSIKIDIDDDTSGMVYRCFKCNESGAVGEKLIDELGLSLTDEEKSSFKKSNKKIIRNNRYSNDYINDLKIPAFSNTHLNNLKLKYINDRLGINITLENAKDYKVVINLEEFMKFNKMKYIPNVKDNYLWILNQNYVGFLNAANSMMIMRNIDVHKDYRRYAKLILDPNNKNPATFFNIPTEIPLMTSEVIKVHVAEGVFDILSIYKNLEHDMSQNHIFFAIGSSDFNAIIKYLVYTGLGGNIEFHLYCDNDRTDFNVIYTLNKHPELKIWLDKIILHRNQYEVNGQVLKDYGYKKEFIIDGKKEI